MSIFIPKIKESLSELNSLERKQQTPNLRKRVSIIRTLKQGPDLSQTAALLNIPKDEVQLYWTLYSTKGMPAILTKSPGTTLSLDDRLKIRDEVLKRGGSLTEAQRRLYKPAYILYGNIESMKSFQSIYESRRATFEAVTDALENTSLTDSKTGQSLGIALNLITEIERIAGYEQLRYTDTIQGDEQFRLYVKLKPQALETLSKARELGAGINLQILGLHEGYPKSYRLKGIKPSIQISTTRDGSQADIDIDYDSGGNHLKVENSDVRFGKHYDAHLNRWPKSALKNWWK